MLGELLVAIVLDVLDGDTLKVSVPRFKDTPFYEIGLRVDGIDTPEKRKPAPACERTLGLAATAFARTLVKPGDQVLWRFVRHDKFGGRVDAIVILPGSRDMAKEMTGAGLARPYHGERKKPWC